MQEKHFAKYFASVIFALGILCISSCNALGAQNIQFSTIDASISFPESFLVHYRTMDESAFPKTGMTKQRVLEELIESESECEAWNRSGDLYFCIGLPESGYIDYSMMSESKRNRFLENYESSYIKNGYRVDSISFFKTPFTLALHMQYNYLLSDNTSCHVITYNYINKGNFFVLSVVSIGAPFKQVDIDMCNAIAQTVRFDDSVSSSFISLDKYSSKESGISFSIPASWCHTNANEYSKDFYTFTPYDSDNSTVLLYSYLDFYEAAFEGETPSVSRKDFSSEIFSSMSQEDFELQIVRLLFEGFADTYATPLDKTPNPSLNKIELGNKNYLVSSLELDAEEQSIPLKLFLYIDYDNAYIHCFIFKNTLSHLNSLYLDEITNMLSSAEYTTPQKIITESSNSYKSNSESNPVNQQATLPQSISESQTQTIPFQTNYEAIDQAAQSVFLLEVYNRKNQIIGTGSGFVAFDTGTLVTNEHVIEDAAYIIAYSDQYKAFYKLSSLKAVDKNKDIALLEFDARADVSPLPVDIQSRLLRGQPVTAIGSPQGVINTVSSGNISNIVPYSDEILDCIQFTAPISPGSSGGALFNDKGSVIGLCVSSLIEGEAMYYAIPMKYVEELWSNTKNTKAFSLSCYNNGK